MNGESITIYDIASDAGVSIATVSRVLRGESNVSDGITGPVPSPAE